MRFTEEHICWDAPNQGQPAWSTMDINQTWTPYHSKGATPARMPYHGQCDVEIHLCYYERGTSECNGIQNSQVSGCPYNQIAY